MVYEKSKFEEALFANLGTTEELMEDWKTNPYYMDESVAARFWDKVRRAPAIAVVGDYDVDGICGTYIMGKAIKHICPDKKLFLRIPRRFSEGYGINDVIVDEIMQKLPKGSVVVTVDNGISAADVLERLEASGYPVLMTDHHQLKESGRIPNVTFAIDPVVPEISEAFGYKGWCGAAVAFKLCEQYVPEKMAKEFETFAGLATVADSMELKGGNWGLVRKSVETFQKGLAPATLSNVVVAMGKDPLGVDEETFGWYLGPCLNAPGRLQDRGAANVLSYLFSPNEERIKELVSLNEERKSIRDSQLETLVAKIEEEGKQNDCPIWIAAPGLHEGIIGILAGKIAEKYGVPAIVGTYLPDNPNLIKASGRTAGDFNLFKYLQYIPEKEILAGKYGKHYDGMPKKEGDAIVEKALNDWFVKFGGHKEAAGLTMEVEKWEAASKKQTERPKIEDKNFGVDMDSDKIPEIASILTKFKPFGTGNVEPIFSMEFDYKKENAYMFGKPKTNAENNHMKAKGQDSEHRPYEIVHFYHDPNSLSDKEHFGINGHISYNYYKGASTPSFRVDEAYDLEAEREIETDKNMDYIR